MHGLIHIKKIYYLISKAQIALFIAEKITVSTKYSDFANIFS